MQSISALSVCRVTPVMWLGVGTAVQLHLQICMMYWLTCLHGKSQLPLMLKVTALHSDVPHIAHVEWRDLSWFVLTNWTRPYVCQVCYCTDCYCTVCYCTDCCQHKQTVLCIMWGWLLLWCMNRDLLQSFNAFFALCNCWYFIKNKLSCLFFLRLFHVLLLVFHKVVELNRHLTLRFCCIVFSWIVLDWNWYFGWTHFCQLHLYPENMGSISPQSVGTHAGNHCLTWSASCHTWGSLPYKLL